MRRGKVVAAVQHRDYVLVFFETGEVIRMWYEANTNRYAMQLEHKDICDA